MLKRKILAIAYQASQINVTSIQTFNVTDFVVKTLTISTNVADDNATIPKVVYLTMAELSCQMARLLVRSRRLDAHYCWVQGGGCRATNIKELYIRSNSLQA
jgi:hypothetical protein